jgi:hypothetical protein
VKPPTTVTVEIHCRLTVTMDDPEAVAEMAVQELRAADIDWAEEEDDLETAAAELRADPSNALAGLAEPDFLFPDVPGVTVTGGHIWAERAE